MKSRGARQLNDTDDNGIIIIIIIIIEKNSAGFYLTDQLTG